MTTPSHVTKKRKSTADEDEFKKSSRIQWQFVHDLAARADRLHELIHMPSDVAPSECVADLIGNRYSSFDPSGNRGTYLRATFHVMFTQNSKRPFRVWFRGWARGILDPTSEWPRDRPIAFSLWKENQHWRVFMCMMRHFRATDRIQAAVKKLHDAVNGTEKLETGHDDIGGLAHPDSLYGMVNDLLDAIAADPFLALHQPPINKV